MRLFGNTFKLPDELNLQNCAKMKCWARGEELMYPPLPRIEDIGEVSYESVCHFTERAPRLWPPSELRGWLQSRHYGVTRRHQMEPCLHPKTMAPLRGLVELVEEYRRMPREHQTQPMSLTQAEDFGRVDPTMWRETSENPLTLKKNMKEILKLVKRFKITDQTILDR